MRFIEWLRDRFDGTRTHQAAQEFAHTFFVVFVPLVVAFANGMHTGDRIVVPDFGTVRAFVVSAFGSAALAGAKAAWWYVTGTKVIDDGAPATRRKGEKVAVRLDR